MMASPLKHYKNIFVIITAALLAYMCLALFYEYGKLIEVKVYKIAKSVGSKLDSQFRTNAETEVRTGPNAPNIVLIVADDLGFNDIGYHNKIVISPTLDRLAKSGVIMENYYVQPICSPTRSQLLSGRYQIHTGLQHGIIQATTTKGVPVGIPMVSDKLREAGYATHAVGKWHLGIAKREYWPTYRGFDSFFGFLGGHQSHYSRKFCIDTHCGRDLRNNTQPIPEAKDSGKYSTNLFADKAIEIIEKHDSSKPLFLYLAFSAVHAPLHVPDEYRQLYKNHTAKRQALLGMVTCLDEAVANVTKSLQVSGLWDNTVLIFTTDNGGSYKEGGSNYPLRKGKGSYFEGGIRAIGFVNSPLLRKEVQGTISRDLIHVSDWFPTFIGLAGLSTSKQEGLDGFYQWDTINGLQKNARSEMLINIDNVSRFDEPIFNDTFDSSIRAAIRVGHWKLLTGQPPSMYQTGYDISKKKFKNTYLFDITHDPWEKNDQSSKRPDIVKQLLDKLQVYQNTSVPHQRIEYERRSDPKFHGGFWDSWL